ncbi:hypothetical protein DFJ73DRAFT_768073 [Zopfochytrium polystomum]|nr:hypothetical protein DFJ73DRAFT_768073 [Zopfochytrium polystomum]
MSSQKRRHQHDQQQPPRLFLRRNQGVAVALATALATAVASVPPAAALGSAILLPTSLLSLSVVALSLAGTSFASSPNPPTLTSSQLLEEAKTMLAATRYHDALNAFDAAAETTDVDPNNPMIYFRRAAAYLSLGKASSALRDFSKVLELRPNFDQALLQRGKLHLKSCDADLAAMDFERYLKANPTDVSALEALQEIEVAKEDMRLLDNDISTGAFEQALERLSRLSATCPLKSELRLKRVDIYLQTGDKVMAVGDLTRVAQLHPDDTSILRQLISLQLSIGDTTAALSTLKECLKQDPEHKVCKTMFRDLKKLEKSFKALDTSVEFANWKSVTEKLLGSGGVVEESERMDALEYKRRAYRVACKAFLGTRDAQKAVLCPFCDLGEAHILAEEYESAVRDYETANKLDQNDRRVHEGYHKAQRLMKAAARKDYYKVLGVPRTASKRDIKKAYRKLAQEWHPDKYKGELSKDQVLKKMSDINEAYETLTDDEKREKFDNGEDPNDQQGGQPHHGQPFFFQQGNPFGGAGGNPFSFHFQF